LRGEPAARLPRMPEDGQSTGRGPALAVAGALGLLAAIVALAALLDLGPFGDDGTTESLSRAEFIAKGDEICRRAHDQFAELQPNPPITAQKAAALQEELIQISEGELSRIRALDAPPEIEVALNRYLRAREQGIALLGEGLQAAKNDDAFAYDAARQRLADGQVDRLELAEAVGFTDCSVVPTGTAGG
jgi:hypothetical protein